MITLALLNMFMFARAAGIGMFSSFSRSVGILLFLGASLFIMVLLRNAAKNLSKSLTEPIYELQDAMKKLTAGDFDIQLSYEGKDELSAQATGLDEMIAKFELR